MPKSVLHFFVDKVSSSVWQSSFNLSCPQIKRLKHFEELNYFIELVLGLADEGLMEYTNIKKLLL